MVVHQISGVVGAVYALDVDVAGEGSDELVAEARAPEDADVAGCLGFAADYYGGGGARAAAGENRGDVGGGGRAVGCAAVGGGGCEGEKGEEGEVGFHCCL
ncbi:hypothetical protein P171DRAFT_493216 [Karstenula rhodostoma CBS 690.94]|uniref:Uncharacterized protein n=1 Tax=Karstenula rhodostoma CBS 690.94 TaxID=1392251 RepID=A0A9P4PWY1_9PLEO|nr:hypothetical protein P171DRAFT_493216 [Karstenula rhodostoma CBS 690.94]